MNSSFNGNDLISYPNQPFCFRPFSFESNPSSKLQQSNSNSNYTLPPPPSPLSFFQFDNHENNNIFLHHDLLLHHHQSVPDVTDLPPVVPPSIPLPMDQQILPRKRSSKRDRHSKINTARGLRDRRMRLSLEVAKRFFGLQDMLGFDKASKTVEWLLNQAKVEIKQIARAKSGVVGGGGGAKSASSTSECEGVSSLDEVVVSRINQEKEREQPHVRRRTSKVSRKSALNPIGKESREKARERARERTIQKHRTRRLATTESNLNRLSCWNPFETVEDSGGAAQSQSVNHPSLPEAHEEPTSHANKEHLGTVEEDMAHQDNSFVIMSKWSPTMIFNSLSNSSILQEHQFAEFQSLGKPWEACENHIY